MKRLPATLVLAVLATSISPAAERSAPAAPAAPAAAESPVPWTHRRFLADPDNFTFAIVGDLTGGERAGVFDVAIADLNLLAPEFVMSVGDLIEGYTEDEAEVDRQWDAFDTKVHGLDMPFFYTAGNHDFSNPVMREIWAERRGRTL